MKKVIFICLLSISTCLSRPEDTPAKAAVVTKSILKVPDTSITLTTPPVVLASHADNATAKNGTTVAVPAQAGTGTQPQSPAEATVPVPPKGVDDKNTTKPDANSTTDKAPKNETVTPADNKAKSNETVTPATDKNKTETTTLKPEPTTKSTPKPTETPKATDTPQLQARGFDGPSFIGGIILTLGLLAIGFMGFKYYKNQTERNYHTL